MFSSYFKGLTFWLSNIDLLYEYNVLIHAWRICVTERNYIITYIYIYFLQTKYYQMCESNTLLILGSLNSLNTICLTRSFMSTIYIVIFEAGSNLQISCFLNERFKYTVLSTLHIILKHSLQNYCKSFLCMFGAFRKILFLSLHI